MKLDIKDVHSIELDFQAFTVKCKTATGYVLWETRKNTLEEAQEVQDIIVKKQLDYLRSVK